MKHVSHAVECNFDGLVGPTHNYAGLAYGNVASGTNAGTTSSPKKAALQGLAKMRVLMELGIPQAVLPPQQRPNLELLRSLGFSGTQSQILQKAGKYQPQLLAASYSAASMWAANAATVSPSCNTADHKVHITPANLTYNLHRAQEAEFNSILFKKIFGSEKHFTVHKPLPAYRDLSDEGAANHSNLCKEYGTAGLELYVYGREGLDDHAIHGTLFPARQTKLASSSIARQHLLKDSAKVFLQQNPTAIDAGVFHNDVIFVANKNVLFYHAAAFIDNAPLLKAVNKHFGDDYTIIEVQENEINLQDCVISYVFNSQLVSSPSDGGMALILPSECQQSQSVYDYLQNLVKNDGPIKSLHFVECRESMRNGGGPACLRLRIVLTPEELLTMHQGVMLDNDLYETLIAWVNKHYRDTLTPEDLLDPMLIDEVNVALDELTQILDLGSIYSFQR